MKPASTVRFQIITILVGLSLDKAISRVADKDLTTFTVLCVAYFTINVLNFYHAKLVTAEGPEYKESAHRAIYEIVDYLLNALLMISFLIIALFVDQFIKFLYANIAMRIVDLAMILFSFITVSRSARGTEMLKAERYWIAYNLFTIFLLGVIILLAEHCNISLAVWMPCILLASVVLDIALDYFLNWRFYFPIRSDEQSP